jgi:hypothetical protein
MDSENLEVQTSGAESPGKSIFGAFREHVATILATVTLFVAVAGVVFAPSFMSDESVATNQTQARGPGATATAAVR